jgi:signal peptidase
MPKAIRIAQNILLGVLALLGVVSLIVAGLAMIAGIKPVAIVSGSMSPTIRTGSLVMVELIPAGEIKVGDIITVERKDIGDQVTHRVVSVEEGENGQYILRMKGDANGSEDPDPYRVATASRYVFQIPLLGFVAGLMRANTLLLVGILAVLLVLGLWGRDKVDVHMPDGEVIEGVSKRQAKKLITEYEANRAAAEAAAAQPPQDLGAARRQLVDANGV